MALHLIIHQNPDDLKHKGFGPFLLTMTISKFIKLIDDNTLLKIHSVIDGYWYKPLGSKLDKADRANIDTFILCSLGSGATVSDLLGKLPKELKESVMLYISDAGR